MNVKFSNPLGDATVNFSYGNTYHIKKLANIEQLVIGADKDPINLMLALAKIRNDGFRLLYILLLSRAGENTPGRYHHPDAFTYQEIVAFCHEYGAFLESDGRHHFWMGSSDNNSTLVYDQHNVIYAYGDVPRYIDILRHHGFTEGDVRFPTPHQHHYHMENDAWETKLLKHWEWVHSPLHAGDEY